MLQVGLIGFGKMGRIRADTVQSTGRATVVGVHDPGCTSEEYFELAEAPATLLGNPDIDAIFICTPNYLNMPLTIEALERGKHVFCEKPPAFSAREVEEIREAERISGKVLMYGFNHRHHTSINQMKSLIDSKKYGNLLWMRGRYGKSVDPDFYEGWRAKRELAGGGILLDQGIHMLDLFLYLHGGPFDETAAFVNNLYWDLDIEDNVFAILRDSASGVVASLHSTMTQWRHLFSLEVFLSKGYLVLNGLKTSSGTYGEEVLSIAQNRTTAPAATWGDEERITFHEDKSWRSEVEHFFDAIEGTSKLQIGNSEDALMLMRMVDALYGRE